MPDDVPGYRVMDQVGQGGFSVVYRAHQERLDRVVALKVLNVGPVDDAAMRRFTRECRITGRLTGHPHIVTVLDTGMTNSGAPFIAMEYFEHGSLAARVEREGPLPVADVLRVGVKIASALAAVHEAGVLHRDVKPQNVLISRYGEPALADFGVALLTETPAASQTAACTPQHAAPEVLNGVAPRPASDVYALGSTLYQLLAGAPAFPADPDAGLAALIARIINEPPPPIERSDLRPEVFEAVCQAMAKDPDDRFPTAISLATNLRRLQLQLGFPVTELPLAAASSTRRSGSARTGTAGAATAGAATAGAASAGAPGLATAGVGGAGADGPGKASDEPVPEGKASAGSERPVTPRDRLLGDAPPAAVPGQGDADRTSRPEATPAAQGQPQGQPQGLEQGRDRVQGQVREQGRGLEQGVGREQGGGLEQGQGQGVRQGRELGRGPASGQAQGGAQGLEQGRGLEQGQGQGVRQGLEQGRGLEQGQGRAQGVQPGQEQAPRGVFEPVVPSTYDTGAFGDRPAQSDAPGAFGPGPAPGPGGSGAGPVGAGPQAGSGGSGVGPVGAGAQAGSGGSGVGPDGAGAQAGPGGSAVGPGEAGPRVGLGGNGAGPGGAEFQAGPGGNGAGSGGSGPDTVAFGAAGHSGRVPGTGPGGGAGAPGGHAGATVALGPGDPTGLSDSGGPSGFGGSGGSGGPGGGPSGPVGYGRPGGPGVTGGPGGGPSGLGGPGGPSGPGGPGGYGGYGDLGGPAGSGWTAAGAGDSGGTGRKGVLLIAGAAVFAVVVVVGIVALVLSRSGGGHPAAASPPPAPVRKTSAVPVSPRPTARRTAPAVSPARIRMDRPRDVRVKAVDHGHGVVLRWKLTRAARELPLYLHRTPGAGHSVRLRKGARGTTIGHLKPKVRYCFQVFTLVRKGDPPILAKAHPVCTRAGKAH